MHFLHENIFTQLVDLSIENIHAGFIPNKNECIFN